VFLGLLVLVFPALSSSSAASAVPQVVLDARQGLVRIFSYVGSDVYSGTGFAVGDAEPVEYIVTNYHVVSGDDVEIEVSQSGFASTKATIYCKSLNADLCVLRLDEPLDGLLPLGLDDETEAATGSAIYTLGFPGAADALSGELDADPENVTVTDGIISAVKMGALREDGPKVKLIQINASINPGNSGGPLMNEDGYVIGINTFTIWGAQNLNGAVSVEALTPLLETADIPYLSQGEEGEEENSSGWVVGIAVGGALAAGGTVVLIILLRKRPRGGKAISFGAYFFDKNQPFSSRIGAALALVEQVAALHAKGQFGFDICPETITISNGKAVLMEKHLKNRPGMTLTRPGYSAPEMYAPQGAASPWSDVYAVAAVLYTVMTGRTLPPAFSRRDEEPVFPEDMDERYKPLTEAISSGLALDYQRRPSNLELLKSRAAQLLSGLTATSWVPEAQHRQSPTAQCAPQDTACTRMGRKAPRKRSRLLVPALCLAGLLVVCGGLAILCEAGYANAVALVDSGEYQKADENLRHVFIFYKDTHELGRYIQAEVHFSNGRYEDAAAIFDSLGEYRDARDMALEATYQQGQSLINNGLYEEARHIFIRLDAYKDAADMALKAEYLAAVALAEAGEYDAAAEAFSGLAEAGYADSEAKLQEVQYRRAQAFIDSGQLTEALAALLSISEYKDSAALMEQVKADIYEDCLIKISEGNVQAAQEALAYIYDYKDAGQYMALCGVLDYVDDVNTFTREGYQFMQTFSNIDLSLYYIGDAAICYYLEGSWRGADGSFEMEMDEDGWYATSALPNYIHGDLYEFSDGAFIVYSNEEDMTGSRIYQFSYVDLNTIDIYSYISKATYRLYRL
jgi:tetratricopeptide (TPR) repeat protein